MTRNILAAMLYRAHRTKSYFVNWGDKIYSVDEIMSMLAGRDISYEQGTNFIYHA